MKKLKPYTIGDRVLFGAYGDFSDPVECTITEICEAPTFFGSRTYKLKGTGGQTFDAYSDEIRLKN